MANNLILEKRKNGALRANPNVFSYPRSSDVNITTAGSDVYWAITALMGFVTLIFLAWSFTVPRRNRIFHYITLCITLVACIAYFTMASNLGYAAIEVEFKRARPNVAGLYREVFYVRYIDWFVTTPLLLLDLLLTAGLPWPMICYTILLDEIMIITGLVGALVMSSYKWGYFVFAMVALFLVAWNVMWVGRKHARALGGPIYKTYNTCGCWTMILWFLYPIAWGCSEGGNFITPDSEATFYAVLDVLSKVVFGFMLLNGHRNIDPATIGIHIRDYDDDMPVREKNGLASAAIAQNTTPAIGTTTGATTTGVHTGGVHPTAAAAPTTTTTTTGTSAV
ncbi:hypothetical protein HYALB_00005930 [Hymenoscyphus albidus]|uniref:Opsin-like protein n=1 Tax=Hymenoscyphus albidus TaxID=595503 RepID=A0A9N9Q7U0_9HELO|nr:hypothetical protein HYALB_00005930 [Hymenoscyphus albidus]